MIKVEEVCGKVRSSFLDRAPVVVVVALGIPGLLTSCLADEIPTGDAVLGLTVSLDVGPGYECAPSVPCETVQQAHDFVAVNGADDYVLVLHEGAPAGQQVFWTASYPNRSIVLRAAAGERPVFDGGGTATTFIRFHLDVNRPTNITVEGLTIRNYTNAGIYLEGWAPSQGGPITWNGSNVIRGNVFEDIGGCPGYAGVLVVSSRNNLIENNVFRNLVNCTEFATYIHALYLNYESTGNQIVDNYVEVSSGSPFRFRNDSNDNVLIGNFTEFAGAFAPVSRYRTDFETQVDHNWVFDSVFHFPFPGRTWDLDADDEVTACQVGDPASVESCGVNEFIVDQTSRDWILENAPGQVTVTAVTSLPGTLGNGHLVVAIRGDGLTRVLRSKLETRFVGDVIFVSKTAEVVALTSGDYDGDGVHEVIAAIKDGGVFKIYKGSGVGPNGLTDGGLIYTSAGTSWQVTYLASGDFSGSGSDQVVPVFYGGSETRVYRGDGVTSALNHGQLYSSTFWKISGIDAGDFFSGGGDEIVTAFTSSGEDRVYVGNGTSNLTSLKWIFQTTSERITALAAGTFDGDTDTDWDLVTAVENKSSGWSYVYLGNGTSYRGCSTCAGGVKNRGLRFGPSSYWDVPHLLGADLRPGGGFETATPFSAYNRVHFWVGNGTQNLTTFFKAKAYEW